jgi:hypothetical protein
MQKRSRKNKNTRKTRNSKKWKSHAQRRLFGVKMLHNIHKDIGDEDCDELLLQTANIDHKSTTVIQLQINFIISSSKPFKQGKQQTILPISFTLVVWKDLQHS